MVASSTFSTALLHSNTDWRGTELISSSNTSKNLFRAMLPPFEGTPSRARLYTVGVGYYKSTIIGRPTDNQLLGPQSTFQVRTSTEIDGIVNSSHSCP